MKMPKVPGPVSGALDTIKWIVIIIVVVIIAKFLYGLWKASNTGAKIAGDAAANGILATKTGIKLVRIVAIRGIVGELVQGYKKYWFGTVDIDEDAWISSLNKLAEAREVIVCSELYKEVTGRSLKSDMESAFDSSDKAKLKSFIIGNIT